MRLYEPRSASRPAALLVLLAGTLLVLTALASAPAQAVSVGRPGSVKASSVSYFSFKISWTKAKNAKGYSLKYSTNPTFPAGGTNTVRTTATSLSISGRTDGTKYYYKVIGHNGNTWGSWSSTKSLTTKGHNLTGGAWMSSFRATATADALTVSWNRAPSLTRRKIGYTIGLSSNRDLRGYVTGGVQTVYGTASRMQATFPFGRTAANKLGKVYFMKVYSFIPGTSSHREDGGYAAIRFSDGLKPSMPSDFAIDASCTGFTARWLTTDWSTNTRGMKAQVSSTPDFAAGTTTTYAGYQPMEYITVSDRNPSTDYWVRVRSVSGHQESGWSVTKKIRTLACDESRPGDGSFKVGSFNITAEKLAPFNQGTSWNDRKSAVATVIHNNYNLVGLQEAQPTKPTPSSQLDQLLGLLRAKSSHWQVVRTYGGVHLLYRDDVLRPVAGATRDRKPAGEEWASYAVAQTFALTHNPAVEFIMIDAHLDSSKTDAYRAGQARAALGMVKELDPHAADPERALPVIMVGDLNLALGEEKDNAVRAAMSATLADAEFWNPPASLGYWSPAPGLSTFNSNNEFLRTPKHLVGVKVDGIFRSPKVAVLGWKQVMNFDKATNKFVGTIPSDHNPLWALVQLPTGS